jgi:hypothetical protein
MRRRGVLVVAAIVLFGGGVSLAAQAPAISATEIALACAPALSVVPDRPLAHALTIVGAQDTVPRSLFGMGELVVVTGGTGAGVQVDQRFALRREHKFGRSAKGALQTIRTTGWVRIVAANENTAIARIEQVCDGVSSGDYLEPFVPPTTVSGGEINSAADLDFSSMGRVLFGDLERSLAGPGEFVMLGHSEAQFAPGARVAGYRDLRMRGVPLTAIGEGVIVSVTNGMPLMRVTTTRDAVQSGDFVVPHK